MRVETSGANMQRFIGLHVPDVMLKTMVDRITGDPSVAVITGLGTEAFNGLQMHCLPLLTPTAALLSTLLSPRVFLNADMQ
jgi:hypothetical protein